jgi:hypothetical protein
MPALKIVWTPASNRQFGELRQRAAEKGRLDEFANTHAEIVEILSDLDQAIEKSDPLYRTKKPGGIVRHFLHKCISVIFCIFPTDLAGWIVTYRAVPASWP